MKELKAVKLRGFVLSPEDLEELLPDVTQAELEDLASIVTDGLMEEWAGVLDMAINIIKTDRKLTNNTIRSN